MRARRKEMKKVLSLLIIGLLCTPMFSVFIPHVIAQETVIFQDDFESYVVGTFPYAGGWQIVWNGAGNQYQVITNSYSHSPSRSLQLVGSYGWSVVVKKDFSTNASIIGYEASLMSTNIAGGGGISFFNRPIDTWGRFYAGVGFLDGYIGSGSVQLQPFTPYTWYKIRVALDKITRKYDVWIDDVLVGKDLVEPNDPNEILSLHIGVGWKQIAHYFDDVKVFSVSSNFDASITPAERTTSIGGAVSYDVTVRNYQETSSNLTLNVVDLDSSWFSLERKDVYLGPGEVASVRLALIVPENPSVIGPHPFSVTVFDGSVQKILKANLTVVLSPIISDLEPKNETTIGSTSILISWKTSSNASSEVYIKRADESTFIRWDDECGLDHFVRIYNLSRNMDYLWYVHSATLYGSVTSEIINLHVTNGLSFTQNVYTFNVERDYAQKAGISVVNTDTQPHDLLLQITNPYDDLIVGFVGAGSVDQTVSVSPNEARLADLYIHSQDAKLSTYSLKINLTNLGAEEIVDYAVVNVNVRQPNINLEVSEISMDNATLTKTYTIINHGDTVTDLQVLPEGPLKTQVQVDPNINHALLRTGESLSFKAVPVLTPDFTEYDGNIQVIAAGETQNVPYTAALPPSKQVFVVVKENITWTVAFNDWYCTNRPRIDERFTLPSHIKKTVDGLPNVDKACVEAYFSLTWPRDDYRPHNVHILMNGVEIGSLMNTIPEGPYLFSFDGYLLNYASEGLAENVLTLQMDNLNGGHYVVSANMRIVLHVKKIEIAVVASNMTEAEDLADELGGTIADSADFAVYPEGITLSNSQPKEGETITISAKIFNFGTLEGNNVPVSFYLNSTLVETKTISVILPLSTQIVNFEWITTKGTHTITIKINEGQTISEKDYSNNQASKSLTVMSIPPEVEVYLVDVMWEFLIRDEEGDFAVEKGGNITVYFKVHARMPSGTVPVNGIEVNIVTSSDSSVKNYTSKPFNGRDGIIQVGPYETANYDGSKFFVRVVDGTFYGIPVISNNLVIGYIIKPRTSTSGVGFEEYESVALGIDVEGSLQNHFLIENDGVNPLRVIISESSKIGAGYTQPFVPGFAIDVGNVLRASAGAGVGFDVGTVAGADYNCMNLPESTRSSLIRDLVTLLILNDAQAVHPELGFVLDPVKSIIENDIKNLEGEACYSPIHAGGWFRVEGDVAARLQAFSSLITIASDVIDTLRFGFDANKLVTAKLISIPGGSAEASVELSTELEIYPDAIGISFNVHVEGYLGFDLGFASFTGQNKGFDFTNELKFDKSTLNLESIVCEYKQEVTTEMFENSQFGGLLKTVRLENLILQPSKTYKITTTVEVPATNAGKLHDLLTASNLLKLGSPSMIDEYDLMQAVAETLMNGVEAEYAITMEQEDAKSFTLELSGLPGLGEVGISFEFSYVQSQSFLKECGYVTSANEEFVTWPAFKYAETPPQSIDVQNFILNNLIDWNSLTRPQGTVVQMQEAQSKLYLHVYDMEGNHVGFNFAQNKTDFDIPSSAYYDNLFGRTEILLPSSTRSFKVTVDGTYAHSAHETFRVGIYRFGQENFTVFQLEEQEIEKGTLRNYLATLLDNGTIVFSAISLPLSACLSPLSASILLDQSVTFTSTVSGGYTPYSYQWYLNGAPVSGATSNTWTFTPIASGIYYIYLKVTDAKADTAQSETARIAVATVPVGGYSFPIRVTTRAEPITPYIVFTAALTAIFTKLRRKTKRKR